MRFCFRCDGNSKTGYGHFSRCLNIARKIKEKYAASVVFIGNFSEYASTILNSWNISFIQFSEHSDETTENFRHHLNACDYFVLDSYLIKQAYIDQLCGNSYKLIVIDDYHKHDFSNVDLVVNFCINGPQQVYRSKDKALGVKYFPVKPELISLRQQNMVAPRTDINHILLVIGGHDINSVGHKVLNVLDKVFTDKHITYIFTQKQANTFAIKNNCLEQLTFVNNIEEQYAKADLTITAGGLSKYESAYCCLLNCNIPQTHDECSDSIHFENQKLSYTIGSTYDFNCNTVEDNLRRFINEADKTEMLRHCIDKFDTFSLDALANKIIS